MKKVDPATIELYVLYDLYVCLTDVCIDRCKRGFLNVDRGFGDDASHSFSVFIW